MKKIIIALICVFVLAVPFAFFGCGNDSGGFGSNISEEYVEVYSLTYRATVNNTTMQFVTLNSTITINFGEWTEITQSEISMFNPVHTFEWWRIQNNGHSIQLNLSKNKDELWQFYSDSYVLAVSWDRYYVAPIWSVEVSYIQVRLIGERVLSVKANTGNFTILTDYFMIRHFN